MQSLCVTLNSSKIRENRPEIGTEITAGWPQVDPRLTQRWPKVDRTLTQGWPKVDRRPARAPLMVALHQMYFFFGRRKVLALFFRPIGATVDLEKGWKMTFWWPKSVLIQPRTSLGKSDVSWRWSPQPAARPAAAADPALLQEGRPETEAVPVGGLWSTRSSETTSNNF